VKVRWRNIIGFTTGYFDIMHPGHVLMLEECKRYCDYLIVGVNDVENWETDSWERKVNDG
jgi:cytidyltransferase-like protein